MSEDFDHIEHGAPSEDHDGGAHAHEQVPDHHESGAEHTIAAPGPLGAWLEPVHVEPIDPGRDADPQAHAPPAARLPLTHSGPGVDVFGAHPATPRLALSGEIDDGALSAGYASAWALDATGSGVPAAIALTPPVGEPLPSLAAPLAAYQHSEDHASRVAGVGDAASALWAAFAQDAEPTDSDGHPLDAAGMLARLGDEVSDPFARMVIGDALADMGASQG